MKLKHSSAHYHVRSPSTCSCNVAHTVLPSVGYLHFTFFLSQRNEFLPVNKRVDFTTVNQAAGCSCSAPVLALFPWLPFERDYIARMYVFRRSVPKIVCFLCTIKVELIFLVCNNILGHYQLLSIILLSIILLCIIIDRRLTDCVTK